MKGVEPTAEAAAAAALHKSLGVRNARLQESLAANADVRPRTLEWLLRQLGDIYRARAADDDRRRAARQPLAPPAEFLFAHLSAVYGTRSLVDRSCAELAVTVAALAPVDSRVALFRRFVSEEWDGDAMALFLDGMSALGAASPVPCVELPVDAQPRGVPPEPAGWVDARKALAVGDRLLGPRPPANSEAWMRALEAKACSLPLPSPPLPPPPPPPPSQHPKSTRVLEGACMPLFHAFRHSPKPTFQNRVYRCAARSQGVPLEAEEVIKHFSAHGMPPLQARQAQALALAEPGAKVPRAAVLEALCAEHVRCEAVLKARSRG
jgi:hypothetical protein